MADVGKAKADEKQNNNGEKSDSDTEITTNDKKAATDKKGDKKNAPASTSDGVASKIKPPAKKRVKAEQVENNNKEKEKEEPKSKKKKPASKVKEEEDEDDDEGSGEENGVPDKVPLLDQPLEVSGSRERKQVERFIPKEELKTDADKKIEIPDGSGTPLGEIRRIQYNLNKENAEGLKMLHRVLFNRVGQTHSIKKNITKFNGFEFKKDSNEYKKKLVMVTKLKNNGLKSLCTLLDLAKSGRQADLAERIVDFLVDPQDSGKEPPDPRPKRKGISSKSYKEKGEEEEEKKKGKPVKSAAPGKKKKSDSDEDDEEEDDHQEDSGDDEKKTDDVDDGEEADESAGSEEEKPKKAVKRKPVTSKKNAKAETAKAKKKPAGGRAVGSKKIKVKDEIKEEEEEEDEEEEEEEEENEKVKVKEESEESDQLSENEEKDDKEPPSKKKKNPPTDDEITSYVKSIIEGADLKEITMNTVCSKVYEHYPDFDLSHKKKLIKTTVKSLI